MSRIILIPQYPSKLRYQEFFISEIPKQLSYHYDDVIVLGLDYVHKSFDYDKKMFSPIKEAIAFEQGQISEYLNLDIKDDDTLLLMDLSFTGLFSNVLYHKPVKNAYAYCHATSKNKLDYFEKVSDSKFLCETGHSRLFKKIFVGSNYHRLKLGWNNVEVIGLPIPPFETFKEEKIYNIISASRPTKQKVSREIENIIEKDFSKIVRKNVDTWEQYYRFLSQGKVLLVTAKEDTFGYQLLEANLNGTVVLAPNICAYPELLSDDYLYNDVDDLKNKLKYYLKNPNDIKNLINYSEVYNFYRNLVYHMKKH